jgi:hypothetical protein
MEFEPLFAESDADDVDVVSLEQFPRTPAERTVGEPLYAQYRHQSDACYRRGAWPPSPSLRQEPVAPPYYRLFQSEDAQMDCDAALASKIQSWCCGMLLMHCETNVRLSCYFQLGEVTHMMQHDESACSERVTVLQQQSWRPKRVTMCA